MTCPVHSIPAVALGALCALLTTLLALPSLTAAQEAVFADGFEWILLDCVRKGYPCTLADADPNALARVETLLQQAWDVRHAGTMEDVHTFLESQPDVVEVDGNFRFVVFRVEGMSPAIFDDVTVVRDAPPAPGTVARPIGAKETRNALASQAGSARPTPLPKPEEVVGEDANVDGNVDQKDIKRALVLAPYEWQFAPNDESGDLASRLELLPAYAGNVVFKSNPSRDDANIAIEDWLFLASYDVVAVATHGSRECTILPDLSNECVVWISSGVAHEWGEPWPVQVGLWAGGYYDDTDLESQTTGRIDLSLDFWNFYYNGALDNQLLSFAACETGNLEGSNLAAAIGGNAFVTTGWTEVVPSSAAFPTALAFYEELSKGLTTQEAFDIVAGLGLFPVLNSKGIETSFEVFSPQNEHVRLIELPRLMYGNVEMPEGLDINDLVDGRAGDGDPDGLQLTVQIDGVTPESKPDFQVRYRVQDQDASGSYDLSTATLVDGYEYRYEVTHDVSLGFPLASGETPIEVIVDLPEFGDSRYTTSAFVASCWLNASVSGDTSAYFDGPAQFQIGDDGSINVNLRSRGYINGDPATAVQANFSTGPATPLVPGSYNIAQGALNITQPTYSAYYFPEAEIDCPTCGGTVTIDAVVEEQSLAGSASFTMVRVIPDPGEEQPTVTLDVDFVAAFGSQFVGTSPYVICSTYYGD